MNPSSIYGLIGYPVKHSLSPAMHMAAFKKLGINSEYRLFEVKPEELENFLLGQESVRDTQGNAISPEEVTGFNITIPHKINALSILEKHTPYDKDAIHLHPELHYVTLAGAINTVKRVGSKLEYFNTDAPGFLKAVEDDLGFDPKGKDVLLIGCGGASRAIVAGLSWKSIEDGVKKIYINDISSEAIEATKKHFSQFEHIKERIEFITTDQIAEKIKECGLLVNATPLGMKAEDASVVDKSLLHKDLFIYDVVYNREKKSQLFRDAQELGLPVRDGLSMLLYQGVYGFAIWNNLRLFDVPIEAMREALNEAVK